jgi:hypothetical protein
MFEKEIFINEKKYTICVLPIEHNLEIMRLTVLRGLIEAPFKINRRNVESLDVQVLAKLCDEIGLLSQQFAQELRRKLDEGGYVA